MNRTRFASVMALCAVSLAFGATPCVAENLLANADMEGAVNADGVPDGWFCFRDNEGDYTIAVGKGGRRSSKCLKVSGKGAYAGAASSRKALDRSKRYMAAAWILVEGKGQATVKFDYFNADGGYLGSTYSSHVGSSEDWQICIVTQGAKDFPEAKSISVAAVLNGNGTASFDDFVLVLRDPHASESEANLLANGSIEAGTGNSPAHFFTSTGEDAEFTMSWSMKQPRSGYRCLHVKGKGDYAVFAHANVSFDPDRKYIAGAWGRVRSGKALLKVDYFRDGTWLGEGDSVRFTGDEWSYQRLPVAADKYEGANRVGVAVMLQGDGDAWFDDLTLTVE